MAASPKAMQQVVPHSPIDMNYIGVLSLPLTSGALLGIVDPVLSVVTTDGGGSNGLYAYLFDDGATVPEIILTGVLPETYIPGSDLYVEMTWSQDDSNAGDVSINLEYGAGVPDGVSEQAASTVLEEVLTMPEDQGVVTRTLLVTMDGTDLIPGAIVLFRLWRDPTDDDDDYAGGVFIYSLDVKFNATLYLKKNKYLDLA